MAQATETKKVDLEALKDRQPTQDELDAIGQEALAEGDAKTKSDEDKEIERIAAEQAAEADKVKESSKEGETEEQKTARLKAEEESANKEAVDEVKAEQERILNAKDEDLKPEEKEKKSELLKLRGDDIAKKVQAEIESYALKQNISVEDAKKEFESIGKIEEKYGKDSKELAKAYLHLQKAIAKKDEEIKQVQESAQRASMPTVEGYLQLVDQGKMLDSQKKPVSRETLVEVYRKNEPEITANMEDDAVLRLASKAIINNFESMMEKNRSEVFSKAKEKRITLLNSIPEADRKYVADEIKPLLDKYPDAQVMSDAFSIQDVLWWVKGKHGDTREKEAEERGYNRGLSEAKILARKSDNPKGKQGDGSSANKSSKLTDEQKSQAETMYENAIEGGVSKETIYEWFAELEGIK